MKSMCPHEINVSFAILNSSNNASSQFDSGRLFIFNGSILSMVDKMQALFNDMQEDCKCKCDVKNSGAMIYGHFVSSPLETNLRVRFYCTAQLLHSINVKYWLALRNNISFNYNPSMIIVDAHRDTMSC